MARGDSGVGVGALIAGVLVLVAMLVIGSLVARMVSSPGTSNVVATTPPPASPSYVDHGPPIPPSSSAAPRPPLAFNDKDNEKRFEKAKTTVAAVKVAVDAIGTSTAPGDAAVDAAKKACADADREVAFLGGEPHPTVRELVDSEHRLCEYARPLAALSVVLARIEGARKKSPAARPIVDCQKAQRIAQEIQAGSYQDDPTMVESITKVGQLCL